MAARSIRRASAADAAALAGIQVRGWQWGYRGLLPEAYLATLSIEEREARWRTFLGPGSPTRTWLLEEEGRPIAFAVCGPARDADLPGTTGEIYGIYREEDAAGTGAGREIMAHALADLREQAFEHAVLWVLESNARARRFYEIGGWRVDGATRVEQGPEGQRCLVRYRRPLA